MKLNPIKREFTLVNSFKSLKIALFAYPFLVIALLFAVFHNETMQQLPIAIVDQDQSSSSNGIVHKLSALPEVIINKEKSYSDLHQAKEALLKAEVYAVIYIPPRFEQLMLAGQSPEITTFYNNQFMTIGSAMNRSIYTALSTLLVNQKVEQLMKDGVPMIAAKNQVQAISVDLHPVFNPTLSFVATLVNGIFPTMMQILIMMLITASLHHEWQKNPIEKLKHVQFSILSLFYQKMPLYLVVFLCAFLLFDFILRFYFHLPFVGNYIILLGTTLLFLCTSIAIAICFALFVPDKLRNYGFVGIFSSPAFGFTGLIFPQLAMNDFATIWGSILPVSWMIKIRTNILLRNDDLTTITQSVFVLILMLCLALIIGQLKLNKLKKQISIKVAK